MLRQDVVDTDVEIDKLLVIVHALCAPAPEDLVLRQGMHVHAAVEKAKGHGEVILSRAQPLGLLNESDEVALASDFEIAQQAITNFDIFAKAGVISPTTHPLVAYIGAVLALIKQGHMALPEWILAEAPKFLTSHLSALSIENTKALQEIRSVLPQLIPLAKTGEKFRTGRKKEARGSLHKWVYAFISKHPKSTTEQVWQALKSSRNEIWIAADRIVERRELIVDGRSSNWRSFQNLVSRCRKEFAQSKQGTNE